MAVEIDLVHVDEVFEVSAARAGVRAHGGGVREPAVRGPEADRAHVQGQRCPRVVAREHGHRQQAPPAQRASIARALTPLLVGRLPGASVPILSVVELRLELVVLTLEGRDLEGERLAVVPVAHATMLAGPTFPVPPATHRVR